MQIKLTKPQAAALSQPYSGKGPLPKGSSWPSGPYVFLLSVTDTEGPPKWHAACKLMTDEAKPRTVLEKDMTKRQIEDLKHHALWILENVGVQSSQAWVNSKTGPHLYRHLSAAETQLMVAHRISLAGRNGNG